MRTIITLFLLIGGLCSCSGVDYVGNNELASFMDDSSPSGEMVYHGDKLVNVKTIGALAMSKFAEDPDPSLIKFKREKKHYYAETTMFESDEPDRTWFNKGVFDIGYDKKDNAFKTAFSLQF